MTPPTTRTAASPAPTDGGSARSARRSRRVLPAGPALQARAATRDRDTRRRRSRAGLRTGAVLAGLAVLAWVALGSPLLAARSVQVAGLGRLSAEEVLAQAQVAPGTPLLRVDTDGVRARVGRLPAVRDVSVVRAWPGTLRVVVSERVPVASARTPDGWTLVDAAGARFAPGADQPADVPELRPAAGPEQDAAVQVLAGLPAALLAQVADVTVPTPASVRLALRDGRIVVWGPPAAGARKAAVVQALLPRPGKTIDVTSPEVAVVR